MEQKWEQLTGQLSPHPTDHVSPPWGLHLNLDQSLEIEKRVLEIASPATAAVIAQRSGVDPSTHINRALLDDYAQRVFKHNGQTRVAVHAKVKTLSDLDAESLLDNIDRTIADAVQKWDVLPNLGMVLRELVRH